MPIRYLKWCPNGCGKTLIFHEKKTYRCIRPKENCKVYYSEEEAKILNNIKKRNVKFK